MPELVSLLSRGHLFHQVSVLPWLRQGGARPVCRQGQGGQGGRVDEDPFLPQRR